MNNNFLKEMPKMFSCVTDEELKKLHELADKCEIGIEIGSYLGKSTYAIAASNIKKLYAIDIWLPNEKMRPTPKDKSLYETFMDNTKRYKDKIEVVKDYSYNAINYFKENNIKADFIFIDGDHSMEGVKQDWDLFSKIMNPGAIAIFHDWGWDSVKAVIQKYIEPNTVNHGLLPNMWWAEVK